jgi:hypothetical protein
MTTWLLQFLSSLKAKILSNCSVNNLELIKIKICVSFFFKARTDIQRAGVQYILDTVVDSLRNNPQRRYSKRTNTELWSAER